MNTRQSSRTQESQWTRRAVLGATAAAGTTILVRRTRAADFKFVQYHNQTDTGPLHKNLVAMWEAIRLETNGRVETTVYPENNNLKEGDPGALKMLLAGEIQFFTLMGGIIGTVVPMAEVQQVPFSFKSSAEAAKAIDGPLGAYMAEEMAAKGMYLFPVAGFDNGMRQITLVDHPVFKPEDLAGVKIRFPPGQLIFDTFEAFGAQPVTAPANQIYEAIKTGRVGAQENPLAVLEGYRIYELIKYVSMTNHMWSGFNEMAHLATWRSLPSDAKDIITRNVTKYVRAQRVEQDRLNTSLRDRFAATLAFNDIDQSPFRARLAKVYAKWKDTFGTKCWTLLEAEVGKLG